MRKIIAANFITLDGVMEAPGRGDTTLPEKRGWSEPFMSDEVGMSIMAAMDESDAMLLGRKTYQDFAVFWSAIPEEDPFGYRMNNQTKYVLSTTLKSADWKNSTLIQGNLVEEIKRLKQQPGKNISVVGSGSVVNWLLNHDLLDELQLMLCPVVLGTGKRLFPEGQPSRTLKLVKTTAFSTGMVNLVYQP